MTARLRGAWRRVDPLPVVVGVVALVVYALHGTNGLLSRDLAVYSYAGQQVADGVPPYVGILNRAGPLAHAGPAIAVWVARLVGADELFAMRLLFLGFAVATVCAVYLLGRSLFGSRPAALVTAAAFLTFQGFIEYASNGPREKTPMTLFLVIALLAVVKRRWFTAGVFASLATLCLQIAFFVGGTAVLLGALVLARGARLRAPARVVLGGAVPALVYVAYAAATGSLDEAVDAFVAINAEYTTPDPPLPRLEEAWEGLVDAYGTSLWVGIVGLLGLALVAATLVLPAARRRLPFLPALLVLTAAGAASLAWNTHEYDAWPDLFPVLPLAAVGIGALFRVLAGLLPRRPQVVLAASLAVLATTAAVNYSVTTRDHRLTQQRASVQAVLAELPDDATIVSVEAPQPLVLSGRTNPTRHQMFSAGLSDYLDDTWPGGREGFRRSVAEGDADLVALGDPVSATWWRAVQAEYVYVGSAPDWYWLARRTLGEEKIAALREAAGSVSGP